MECGTHESIRREFLATLDAYFAIRGPAAQRLEPKLRSCMKQALEISQFFEQHQINEVAAPLMIKSAERAHVELVKFFLRCGAHPDAHDAHGSTVLHETAKNIMVHYQVERSTCIIKILLKARANPNAQDGRSVTPLMMLAQGHRPATSANAIKLLLRFGADPSIREREEKTAFEYVLTTDRFTTIRKIIAYATKCQPYYALLDLEHTASQQEIKTAYHKLSLEYHPDKAVKNGYCPEESKQKFMRIKQAYEILSDTGARAGYDEMLG